MKKLLFCAALAGVVSCLGGTRTMLFRGRSLTGWTAVADQDATGGYTAVEPTWFVQDKAIRTTGTPFGYLRTKRDDFGDGKIHVEYRWWRQTKSPNSGIFVRLGAEHGNFIPTCIENQLCRGKMGEVMGLAGMAFANYKPNAPYTPEQPLSGITTVKRLGNDVEKPFGEWNVMEIEIKDGTLVNTINGVEKNRVSGIAVKQGAIALQAEGGAIEFRNIWFEAADK